jgi:hypothetical protein
MELTKDIWALIIALAAVVNGPGIVRLACLRSSVSAEPPTFSCMVAYFTGLTIYFQSKSSYSTGYGKPGYFFRFYRDFAMQIGEVARRVVE